MMANGLIWNGQESSNNYFSSWQRSGSKDQNLFGASAGVTLQQKARWQGGL